MRELTLVLVKEEFWCELGFVDVGIVVMHVDGLVKLLFKDYGVFLLSPCA